MQHNLLGTYRSFNIGKGKFNLSGIILSCNEKFTLVRNISDYQLNGFTVFKNDIMEICKDKYEKTAARILKAREYSYTNEPIAPLDSLESESLLSYINQHYQLLSLFTPKGDAMDVVKYLKRKNDKFLFQELTVDAKWRHKLDLPAKECRIIQFDTGYLNSLKLIAKF
jgi:hypothetical protein